MIISIPEKVISNLGVPQVVDVTNKLPVNKNYTWGDLAGWREPKDLTTIAVHHDYYAKSKRLGSTPMQMMTEIADDHIKLTRNEQKGDAGFPYHFYIMRGQIFYTNPVAVRTYGVGGNNGYTVHVCVHGDYYGSDQLTDGDLNCLIAVCLMLKEQLPYCKAIKGHGELNPSNCPGFNMDRVREAVITAENRMVQSSTWSAKLNKIAELGNQYNFMFDLVKAGESDGNAQWAVNQLLDVHSIMKSKGLLK